MGSGHCTAVRFAMLTSISLLLTAPSNLVAAEVHATLVKDIHEGPGTSTPYAFAVLGNVLYFAADDGVHGFELWRSDGTEVGTWMVKDIDPGPNDGLSSYAARIVVFHDRLFFAGDSSLHGANLWTSDGTDDGTHLVADLSDDEQPTYLRLLVEGNDALYFMVMTGDGYEGSPRGSDVLWRSDGTEGGTWPLVELGFIEPGPYGGSRLVSDLRPFGDEILVLIDERFECCGAVQFARVDLSGALHTVYRGDRYPPFYFDSPSDLSGVAVLGSDLVFIAPDGGYNNSPCHLRRGNEQDASVVLIPDQTLSCRTRLFFVGSTVMLMDFFDYGQALWTTDGTIEGTQPIALFTDSWVDRYSSTLREGSLYFTTTIGSNASTLWRSDGTASGTRPLRAFVAGSTSIPLNTIEEGLLFVANDGTGRALWKSNGRVSGTVVVQRPPPGDASTSPGAFTETDSTVFFVARDSDHGTELWVMPRAALAAACIGDCNRDGSVTVDELVTGTMVGLGEVADEACEAFDGNLDAAVTVDELAVGINAALHGCS